MRNFMILLATVLCLAMLAPVDASARGRGMAAGTAEVTPVGTVAAGMAEDAATTAVAATMAVAATITAAT